MLFQVQGLITIGKEQRNIGLVIDAPEETIARNVCIKHSIAIFGFIPYSKTPREFGVVYFRSIEEKVEVTVYTEFQKARDAFIFFRSAGFLITYINNLDNPLSDEDVQKVVKKLESDWQESQKPGEKKTENYFEKLTDAVVQRSAKELDSLKELATKAINDADDIAERIQNLWPQSVAKIKLLQDEAKKVRLGSNETKIRDAVGLLYHALEDIELRLLQEQKEHEMKIAEGSVVTYLDVLTELEKFEKSKKVGKIGARKIGADAYYAFLGSLGLYNKFIVKDIKNKSKDFVILIDTIFSMFAVFVLVLAVSLVILQIINTSFFGGSFFTTNFIDLGLLGVCTAILMRYKKLNIKNQVFVGVGCVILFFVLRYAISVNFAL